MSLPRDAAEFPELLRDALEHALDHEDSRRTRTVFPTAPALAALDTFDTPLPEDGNPPRDSLRLLHECGAPASVLTTGGRYFGFVVGGALPVGVAASWLANLWDQNAGFDVIAPAAARLEAICERWLVQLFGFPDGMRMGCVTGATEANVVGLASARHELLRRQAWDVNARGLSGAPRLRVVHGAEMHSSVRKALTLLGLGAQGHECVPVDAQGRMRAHELPELDEHTLVIAQAGNVDSGSFDPLTEIAERARAAGAWLHVDAAFGLWAAASPRFAELVRGVQFADSCAADAHKTLNVPYDSGLVFCRHPAAMHAALSMAGAYLELTHAERPDGSALSASMSRRARSVELWATLHSLGRRGVVALVEQLCERARRFADGLRAAGFTLRNEVVFTQLVVAAETPELTRAMVPEIQAGGVCWCGGTEWQGGPAVRVSISSWATSESDVDASVAEFVRARAAVRSATGRGDS